jgi:hypothetical protein
MNESNNLTPSNPALNAVLEKKGMQEVEKLLSNKKPHTPLEMQTALINIMKEGEKEFVKENKRTMTYLEMRSLYG